MNVNVEYDWVTNQQQVNHRVIKIDTVPFVDKWPRTKFPPGGLHRPIGHFQMKNYTECFVQSAIQDLHLVDEEIVVGGIGNKLSNKLILKIVRVAAANGISKVYAGERGVMSRPVISALCAKHECWGFLIHAACNPLPNYDEPMIGIDLVHPDGGPIHPDTLNTVLATNQRICAYHTIPTISFSHLNKGHKHFVVGKQMFAIQVMDTVVDYTNSLKTMFDFGKIQDLLNGVNYLHPFKIMLDCNNGAVGPYAKRIFVDELGVPALGSVVKWEPNNNVKTFHPSHVSSMDVKSNFWTDLSASFDPDGSRCVVFGSRGFLVPPGETLAIMALHFHAIPYFQNHKFVGVGRSFLASSSVDEIAEKTSLKLAKTPGDWVYFKRQIETGRVSFVESDNFAIGTSHNAMSDGIWAILMWLTLVIHAYKPIQSILTDHWLTYGRYFLTSYEFHGISRSSLDLIMKNLQYNILMNPNFPLSTHTIGKETYTVVHAGNFPFCFITGSEMFYEDCTLRVEFHPKSQIIFKTIEAGDTGTLKIVVEVFSKSIPHSTNRLSVTKHFYKFAVKLCHVDVCTGKTKADLIY